jgi:REP element-mobilizing transposase RayT
MLVHHKIFVPISGECIMNDEPLAYFITWTVYGTFLQGDERGWRKWGKGSQPAQPRLAEWRRERLKYSIELLDDTDRELVENEIYRLSTFRSWMCWAATARTNHVHVVVTAKGYKGSIARDQFKANATRVLREASNRFLERPVWSELGDWECINTEEDLEIVIAYVMEAQDRKHLDR